MVQFQTGTDIKKFAVFSCVVSAQCPQRGIYAASSFSSPQSITAHIWFGN
jgi:hypothetical protein